MESIQTKITLVFHGNLKDLPAKKIAGQKLVHHLLSRRASVKDVIESFGVPHPEIMYLRVNGRDENFSYIVRHLDDIELWPLTPPVDVFSATLLRPEPLEKIAFAVDVNVGKLANLLRMAGFDTLYRADISDDELAHTAAHEKRILLTRDSSLLKRKCVIFGHLVREIISWQQLQEIICLYQLAENMKPFSRCLRCNAGLVPVAKDEILHRLQPLTKKYYQIFHLCRRCDKIYWQGSHRQSMQANIENLIKQCR